MTDTEARCAWSDLPADQCAHCVNRTSNGFRIPERPRLRVAHSVVIQSAETTAVEIPNAIHAPDQPDTAHDYVVLLTAATFHDEPRTIQQTNPDGSHTFVTVRHRTSSPSLLEQLDRAIEPLRADGDGARVFASKTPARIDALDALQRIDHETDVWLRRLQLRRTDADDLGTLVRRAAAAAGDDIRQDVRAWWILARTVTGWDAPAYRPHNTCPLCERRGSLRVRIDALTAVCVECGEGWDAVTIQLLGNHIRQENGDEAAVG